MKVFFVFMAIALSAMIANAEMVMWVDEDGVKHFSNAGAPTDQSIEIKTEREQKTYDSQMAEQTAQEYEEIRQQEAMERESLRIEEEERTLQQKSIKLEQEQIKEKAEKRLAKEVEMEERRLKEKLDYYRSDYNSDYKKNIKSSGGKLGHHAAKLHRDFGKKAEAQIENKLKLLKDDPDYYFYSESTKQKARHNKNSDSPSSNKHSETKIDPHTGTIFFPSGDGQYINSESGSFHIPTGDDQYLDTQTGEIKRLP
jgi:hypothetical protein